MQSAKAAATAGRPWAADDIATLVHGGLGACRLAHVESVMYALTEAVASSRRQAPRPDLRKPHDTRQMGACILSGVVTDMLTPHLPRTLASRGLVGFMLQVMTSHTLRT